MTLERTDIQRLCPELQAILDDTAMRSALSVDLNARIESKLRDAAVAHDAGDDLQAKAVLEEALALAKSEPTSPPPGL